MLDGGDVMTATVRATLGIGLLAVLMGHTDPGCNSPGAPTEAECDPRLRWGNFGHDFMTRYCTRCHSSTLSGGERHGAPDGRDFDTIDGVQADLHRLDEVAASGPASTNDYMPPYEPAPTEDERARLGRWIACGAPE